MASELVNVSDLGMKEEELFSRCDSNIDSEKITAPRYSYWHSVFRVFFKKKINIVVLAILAFIIIFSYIYPIFSGYDAYANLLDSTAKHLSPAKAIDKWGFSLHTILGTGGAGQSTFDAIWHGAEISLSLAFVCALINMTIGVTVGALWGFSKKVDAVMMVIYNIVGNVPVHFADFRSCYVVHRELLVHGFRNDDHRLDKYRVLHQNAGCHHPRPRI